MKNSLKPLNQRGWTLVELMMASALIGIITPAMTFLFTKVSQGMAADEMHIQLQSLNSQTLLRIHERAEETRHLFQADASGVSFYQAVTAGMSANTLANYPILSGSKMALSQPAPVSSFATFSPNAGGVGADFGNTLLFGAYDSPQTINNVAYASPVSVFTKGASAVTFNDGRPATIVVDLYRFYFYYLTTSNPKGIRGVSSYRLVEWQSIQYADYYEIFNLGLTNTKLKAGVIAWLATPGNVGPGISVLNAWDPSQQDPNFPAFYTLSTTGVAAAVSPAVIQEGQVNALTRVSSGILSNGFGYGVSPNAAGWVDAPPIPSPRYAIASGSFPGGFEVGISGTAAGRQVFTRSYLVAKGGAPRVEYNEGEMVHNVRDVW